MRQFVELYYSEIRYFFKTPIYYLAMITAVIFCFVLFYQDIFDPNFPYDTKQKYENKLGYLDYEDFEKMSIQEFADTFDLHNDQKIHLYEDHLTSAERLKLKSYLSDNVSYGYTDQYFALFNEYERQGKVIDYGLFDAEQLSLLSKDTYEKVKHSLFSQNAWPNYFSLWGENGIYEIPTYEQSVERLREYQTSETFSSVYAREFTRRATIIFAICSMFLSSFLFVKDLHSKILALLKKSNVNPIKYVISKYFAVNTVSITAFFLIYCAFFLVFKYKFIGSLWIFQFSDFLFYFIIQTFVAVHFINAFAIFVSLLLKNGIVAIALSYIYIDFSSSSDLTNKVNYLKFNYHFDNEFNILTESLKQSLLIHQLFYLFLAGFMMTLCILIWKRIVENTERNRIGFLIRKTDLWTNKNFGKWQGLIYYNLKMVYSVKYLIVFFLFLIMPVLFNFPSIVLFEIFFPMLAIFIFADMMSVEKNTKMDQLFTMTSINKASILLVRIIINSLFFIVSFLILWFYVTRFHLYMDLSDSIVHPINFQEYLISYFINVLLFGLLALTITSIFSNHFIALFISMIYWIFWWTGHYQFKNIIFNPFPYTSGVANYWGYRACSILLILVMIFFLVKKFKNSKGGI